MKIFTVEELNTSLKDYIVQQFVYPITIKGSVSNVRMPQSGHQYFKLTDDNGFNKHSIDCVIWRGKLAKLVKDYDMKEVLITGNVTMYKATANCQIQVSDISEYGEGALKKAIDEIRIKLQKEGLFENKKDFPLYPENIGIVTSADSHALQDVISKLKSRYPVADIILYPSLVQGEDAAKNIITQLRRCNKEKLVDIIMLIRGGGSLEDLMTFNDEGLAREISKSTIPLVTGIGHQPDVTIADYVADAAMETPTAAAVFVTPDQHELIQRLIAYDDQIKKNVLIKVNKVEDKYINIVNKINIYHPKNLIENFKMKHKEINTHLISFMELIYNKNIGKFNELLNRFHLAKKIMISRYNDYQTEIIQNSKMIKKLGNELYQDKSKLHRRLHQDLLSVNPASALKKGYSIIRDSEGKILKSKLQVHDNQILSAEFKDGSINLIKANSKK